MHSIARTLRGRARRLCLLLCAVLAAVTAVAAPASADWVHGGYGPRRGDITMDCSTVCIQCSWSNSVPNLGTYCANHDDAWTNVGYDYYGYVHLFWGTDYSGAWACIPPGYMWGKTSTAPHEVFNHGSGSSGYGQSIWNNVASLKWENSC